MATPDKTRTVYDENGKPITVDAQQFEEAVSANNSSQQANTPQQPAPQVVYMARPHEPVQPHISPAVLKRHEDSKAHFPYLNLSGGEYVISAIKRHPIGLVGIWGIALGLIVLLMAGIAMAVGTGGSEYLAADGISSLAMVLLGVIVLVFLGAVIATIVYEGNRFFLTNESVTQHIQMSLFAKKEQTISLGNIEDASFTQHGIIQHMLNYGSLRLSTEGDETTYRFSFVENPSNQVALLNNAVEAFKNGRPVDPDES
jgi:uncharacterized membrane protein YdbT with pleckstrin-like domain